MIISIKQFFKELSETYHQFNMVGNLFFFRSFFYLDFEGENKGDVYISFINSNTK